jgi:hypothetical protein
VAPTRWCLNIHFDLFSVIYCKYFFSLLYFVENFREGIKNCWAGSAAGSPGNGSKCVNVVVVMLIIFIFHNVIVAIEHTKVENRLILYNFPCAGSSGLLLWT